MTGITTYVSILTLMLTDLTPHQKTPLLRERPETEVSVYERAGNTLEVIGIGKDFLNRTPAAQQLRESIDKWDFIKLKSFCTTK
jgi:hypothetical protein